MSSLRAAVPADAPAIEAWLAGRPETTIFLRDNLRSHGPGGGPDPRATRFWLREAGGTITGIVGLSTFGMVITALQPELVDAEVADVLDGAQVRGIAGEDAEVRALRAALGLDGAPARRDEAEPLYALDLDALLMPDGPTELRLAEEGDLPLLSRWRGRFLQEVFATPEAEAAEEGARNARAMLDRGGLAILEQAGTPCAMTGFAAKLPDSVLVGNVFAPPELRGKGHARRAVALHLQRARAEGATRALLTASDRPAARAYEAIGFRQVGWYRLLMFDGLQMTGAHP